MISWKDMTFYFVKCTIFPQSFQNVNVTNEKPHVTLQIKGELYDVMHSQERVGISNSQNAHINECFSFQIACIPCFLFWIFLPWHPMGTHLIPIKYHDYYFLKCKNTLRLMLCNNLGPRHCQNNLPLASRLKGPLFREWPSPLALPPTLFVWCWWIFFKMWHIHQSQSHQSTYEFDRNAKLVY